MANQNLSEFGEKLFVADADHTFIWDTAASISKRVSRNSWLNSGTLTSDAPVTISQTWNNAAVTFTGLKVNAVSTASASGSLLLDLQVGTVSQFNVRKNGQALFSSGIVSAPGITFLSGSNTGIWETSAGVQFSSAGTNAFGIRNEIRVNGSLPFGFASGTPADTGLDVALWRDGAPNTLALRNGAAAQTFNVYGTYTSGTSYERLTLSAPSAANAIIGTNKGSGGGTARGLDLHTDGVARMTITTAGNVGIGTTAPSEKLHVLGGKVLFGDPSDPTGTAGNGELTLQARAFPQLNLVSNLGGTGFCGLNIKVGASDKAGFIVNTGSGEVRMGGLGTGGYFSTFYANAVEAMRILSGGNVGIGTTSPSSKLQVTNGDVEIETVTSGIIMKAAGTANRYRITLNAGGTDFVITAL